MGLFHRAIGLFSGDIGLFCGDVGLFCGDMRLFSDEVRLVVGMHKALFSDLAARKQTRIAHVCNLKYIELFCGDIGLFCGDIGLFCRDLGLFSVTSKPESRHALRMSAT